MADVVVIDLWRWLLVYPFISGTLSHGVRAFLLRIIIPEKQFDLGRCDLGRFDLRRFEQNKVIDLITRSYNEEIGEAICSIEMHNLTFSCYACDSTESWKLISLKSHCGTSIQNHRRTPEA